MINSPPYEKNFKNCLYFFEPKAKYEKAIPIKK